MTADVTIRIARLDDAIEIAQLSGQLGYPVNADEMRIRLVHVLADDAQHVAVADRAGRLVGWISVVRRETIIEGTQHEIVGLVVDDGARRQGVATALLRDAETWIRTGGFDVVVRSNAVRPDSHALYLARGYHRTKTQHVYVKAL
ncbi:MAG: GNAT family N-acetyltransferase [Lysobacterales bacterium]